MDDLKIEEAKISISPATGDLTNFEATYTLTPTIDVLVWVKNASTSTATTWNTQYGDDDGISVGASNEASFRVISGGVQKVYMTPANSGESGTIDISISAESFSPTYCLASDVAALIGVSAFDSTTTPTNTQVDSWILAAEDEIDERTKHAWRAVQVTDEYHDYHEPRFVGTYDRRTEERNIALSHRSIRTLTSGSHFLYVYDGEDYVDYVATKTEGRGEDYWMEYTNGFVFFRNAYPYRTENVLKATYEYGETTVPHGIRNLCAMIVAKKVLITDDYSETFPEGFKGLTPKDKYQLWDKEIERLFSEYREMNKGIL